MNTRCPQRPGRESDSFRTDRTSFSAKRVGLMRRESKKIKGKLEERLQNWEDFGEMSSDIDAVPTSIHRNCHSSA